MNVVQRCVYSPIQIGKERRQLISCHNSLKVSLKRHAMTCDRTRSWPICSTCRYTTATIATTTTIPAISQTNLPCLSCCSHVNVRTCSSLSSRNLLSPIMQKYLTYLITSSGVGKTLGCLHIRRLSSTIFDTVSSVKDIPLLLVVVGVAVAVVLLFI